MKAINPKLLDKRNIGMSDYKHPKRNVVLDKDDENRTLLEMGERYFSDMSDFYTRRRRVRNYIRGKQYSDTITDPDGAGLITEETYIKNQGKVPLKQNLMRNLMKNLSGQYQQSPTKSIVVANKKDKAKVGEMLTTALYYVHQINSGEYLNARNFDEFMLSGLPVAKVNFEYMPRLERPELHLSKVDNRRFVFNTDITDPRMEDVYYVCEIMDLPIEVILESFAKTDDDEKRIRDAYVSADTFNQFNLDSLDPQNTDAIDFYVSNEPGKCRLYAIWYKAYTKGFLIHDPMDATSGGYRFDSEITEEEIEEENTQRILMAIASGIPEENVSLIEYERQNTNIWNYKFLTPEAHCLLEGETPYEHGEHPYVFLGYPMIDGEIWGPLEDVIDQQRLVNRYITMLDAINSAGAKGTWLVPESAKPDDMTKSEYIKEIGRVGGAVWYKIDKTLPSNVKPEQLFPQGSPVGINEMLALQMRLMQEISGQHPSIQGMPAKSGTPASLYAQEAENAASNLLDYMNAFSQFVKMLDAKMVKTIIQFYKEPRLIHVSGSDYQNEAMEYDPEMVDGFDFDLTITKGINTPTYRQAIDEMLFKLFEMQAINVEQFLQNTSLPFADKLLESVRQQQAEMQEGNLPGGFPPELAAQIQAGANPQSMQMLSQN